MAQGSSKVAKSAPKRTKKQSSNPKKGQRTIPPKKQALVKAAAKKKVGIYAQWETDINTDPLPRNYLQNSHEVLRNKRQQSLRPANSPS
jgi:hypothetical protein